MVTQRTLLPYITPLHWALGQPYIYVHMFRVLCTAKRKTRQMQVSQCHQVLISIEEKLLCADPVLPNPWFPNKITNISKREMKAMKKVSNYSFWSAHLTFQSQMVPRQVIWSKTFRRQQGHQAYTHKRKITNPSFPELRSLGRLIHTAA